MLGRIIKFFGHLSIKKRKETYLEKLKNRSQQILGQLPEGMKITSIQGKEEKYFVVLITET